MLTRHRSSRAATALLAAALAAGCARNPVTGRTELALVSEAQEVQMGQQAAQEAAQSIGLVNDAQLQAYVQRVGAELAARTERPNLPWEFHVVDDPTPNAFALPGGFIFVTRGLMGLMSSEAELASVLGHEIGHVTARHSVNQISKQQLAQLGLGLGMILAPKLQRFGDVASQGLGLLFLKFGRDDERQADDLGFRYALGDNYDVRQMPRVFASLQRLGELAHQSPIPSWLATHPDPGERIQRIEAKLATVDRPLAGAKVAGAEYLERVRGLVYGEDPRQGFFQGSTFLHPELRFRIDMPQGWRAQNTTQAVVAVSPQQDAAIQLTLAQGDPVQAARAFLGQQGVRPGQASQQTVNGTPAVVSYFQAQTEQGVVTGLVTFLGHGGRTYQVLAYAPAQAFGQYDRVVRQSLGSFAPLTDPRALAVQPNRIEVVRVDQPTTLAAFNRRYPSAVPLEELALVNQVTDANATLPAGTLVKRVAPGAGR